MSKPFRAALLAMAGLAALAVAAGGAQAYLQQTNGVYTVFVSQGEYQEIGHFAMGTGATFGAPFNNVALTFDPYAQEFATPAFAAHSALKSYNSGRVYSYFTPLPGPGFTVTDLSTEVPVQATTPDGVTTTWTLNDGGDNLAFMQRLTVGSTGAPGDPVTAANGFIHLDYEVCNNGAAAARVGIRSTWDLMINGQDNTYKAWVSDIDPLTYTAPNDIIESKVDPYSDYAARIADPGETLPLYALLRDTGNPNLPEPVDQPDKFMFWNWQDSNNAWEVSGVEGTSLQPAGDPDSVIIYYWGYDDAHAKDIEAGSCIQMDTYVTLDIVSIAPPPPDLIVDAMGPYNAKLGQTIPLTSTITGGVPPFTCYWSGVAAIFVDATDCTPDVHFDAAWGARPVTLTVTDSFGQIASDTATVNVFTNPTASILVDDRPRTCIDSRVSFYAMATDPDAIGAGVTTYSWTWTYSDGTQARAPFSGANPPAQAFTRADQVTVALSIADGDPVGFAGTNSATATLWPLGDPGCPPSLSPIGHQRVPVGSHLTLTFSASDPDHARSLLLLDLTGLPGATLDSSTGAFAYDATNVGLYCGVTITVSDPSFMWDSETICITVYEPTIDSDQDGVFDGSDNCPSAVNRGQDDSDHDSLGDACDPAGPAGGGTSSGGGLQPTTATPGTSPPGPTGPSGPTVTQGVVATSAGGLPPDFDHDGVADVSDNCKLLINPLQEDLDRDGQGDVCDGDQDGDGLLQWSAEAAQLDPCPMAANSQPEDTDGDGVADACPADSAVRDAAAVGALERCRVVACDDPAASRASTTDKSSRSTDALRVGLGVVSLALVATGVTAWAVRRWK